jgi:hypothetical protein
MRLGIFATSLIGVPTVIVQHVNCHGMARILKSLLQFRCVHMTADHEYGVGISGSFDCAFIHIFFSNCI